MAIIESKIKILSDEQILEYWKLHLWKERQDPIRPMSSMLINGDYDMQLYIFHKPQHVGLYINDELVGCNSSHVTSDSDMRSRGLFVDERYRRQGFSQLLFKAVEDHALQQKRHRIWSYPRISALGAYQKFGFKIYEDPNPVTPPDATHFYVAKTVSL